ncbi:hypothetical protein K3495_g2272 [Podosphaera aphanis]|nr:hypothetical protein K3495_g2272 [Podosphaera aphanis]
MTEAEEQARAEKLAAAKKRVEQMKKKKSNVKKEVKKVVPESVQPQEIPTDLSKPESTDVNDIKEESAKDKPENGTESHERKLSVSHLSKLRSSNFRESSALGVPYSPSTELSPEGDTPVDIYRKQVSRIEELEKQNTRLAKEASEAEKRWKKVEEELEILREAEASTNKEPSSQIKVVEDIEKLKAENAALQRQNSQLLARSPRHGSISSMSASIPVDYEAILASKSSTIESMEMEISSLKSVLEQYTLHSSEKQQVMALEDKLSRAEKAAATANTELTDLKRNLDRAAEKAVKEGSERVSAETKLRTVEREFEEKTAQNEELLRKVDMLEKKVSTLATLYKEHDTRLQAQKRVCEKAEKESFDLRIRLAELQKENSRKFDANYVDNEGLDDLENERCERLERKVRDLEEETSRLRRGIWSHRRSEIDSKGSFGVLSPEANFTEVDLRSEVSPEPNSIQTGKEGYSDFITEDDELLDFDEDAFRIAHEREARKRLERIKDIKRSLKNWEGWRLDLVDSRNENIEGRPKIFDI